MEGAAATSRDRAVPVLQHVGELIKYRDEHKTLRFTLLDGKVVEGIIRWFDDEAIHIVTVDRDELTLFKHVVSYYGVPSAAPTA